MPVSFGFRREWRIVRVVAFLPLWCALLSLCGMASPQVQQLWIVDGCHSSTIPAFEYNEVLFASATALGERLALAPREETATGQLTLTMGAHAIVLTAGNPFVVVRPRDGSPRRVHQLAQEVIRTEKSTYVPVASFLPILNAHWNRRAVLDPKKPELRIEARRDLREATGSERPGSTTSGSLSQKTGPINQSSGSVSPASGSGDPAATAGISGTPGSQDRTDPEDQDKKRRKPAQSRWKLDCIVLDAGHGGKDPGAIGVNGTREKHVVLSIVRKVGALLEDGMPEVKVVYTRDRDTFVELDRRGQIANEAGGKLFISVHCNSTEKKPSTANGFEVYLLRPGRTDEAIRIAEFENAVVKLEKDYQRRYAKLTNEQFIVITMAQSAYMKYSERFAELMHLEFAASKRIRSLGVKQAGFYVLVGASMPNVLVETGFLSNPREEAFLASEEGQDYCAHRIYESILRYAREYEKSLEN